MREDWLYNSPMGKPKTPEHREKIRQAHLARGVGKADKLCPGCSRTLPRDAYGYRERPPYYSRSRCKECESKKSIEWHQANPEKARAIRHRTNLRRNYSLTPAQYDELLAKQGGVCAICEVTPEKAARQRLYVDHCAETKRIRGLLCTQCNSGIGMLRHSIDLLASAARYIEDPPAPIGLIAKPGMPSGRT